MEKCPNCAAPLDAYSCTCQYCGFVILDRIKRTPNDPTDITFQESVDVTEANLNMMHDIPVPSFGRALADVFRIYLYILTFGIAAIFWRRPKKRFNKTNYNALKQIVMRNIGMLKLSAKGADDLLARIQLLENEITVIDRKIKRGVVVRTLTYIFVPVAYIFFLQANATEIKQNSVLKVKPVMASVKTEDALLRDILSVGTDSCEITIIDSIQGIYKMPVTLKKRMQADSSKVKNLLVNACFADNPKDGLKAGCCEILILNTTETDKFKKFLLTKDVLQDTLTFILDKSQRRYFDRSSMACSKDFLIEIKN